jgi:iron complex outermembrane recepter protein
MKIIFSIAFFYLLTLSGYTQETSQGLDSITPLSEVRVRGFETGRDRLTVPASVSLLRQRDLQRFSNTSLVPVVNTVPGVRMEERSPGSYRLSIRGSLLRSPFGIRNIKTYWGDFLLTDAGGNTYLNLVDMNTAGSVEIIKGPAGSIYGTGTGGVVVLESPQYPAKADTAKGKNDFSVQLTGGSYGQFSQNLRWQHIGKKASWQISQGHFQADGYRDNSRMRRDIIQGSTSILTGKHNRINAFLLLSNLGYRTPGGLTLAQQEANPRQSRPATPTLPSALDQKAGVYNKTALLGLSDDWQISEQWQFVIAATTAFTGFENPFITNYEKRKETNIGLRSKIIYNSQWGRVGIKWINGFEWQNGYYTIDSTGNNKGVPDANLVRDKVKASQRFIFSQAEFQFTPKLLLQAGISLNDFSYQLERIIGNPQNGNVPVDFSVQAAPRLAISYLLNKSIALHASVSKGFSPPSLAEIRPSAGGFSTDLQAEQGWSYELGLKGSVIRSRWQFELSFFQFDLQDAIVRRTNAAGAEYFINAGGTKQQGVELFTEGYLINNPAGKGISYFRLWSTVTLSEFYFKDYKVNNVSYDGNELTGVPRQVILAGADISFLRHFYLNGTFNYTSRLPLTDANDVYALAYRLWQFRLGWQKQFGKHKLELFAGVDNLADEQYSLGNDLNAFGRRFYNPAPVRNYYGGLIFRF